MSTGIDIESVKDIYARMSDAELKSRRSNRAEETNEHWRKFVSARVGQFETYKNDRAWLQKVIEWE